MKLTIVELNEQRIASGKSDNMPVHDGFWFNDALYGFNVCPDIATAEGKVAAERAAGERAAEE